MEFEWDEAKRLSNLEKHDIDFVDVRELFSGRLLHTTTSSYTAEERFITTGRLNAQFITVIWTWRGQAIRIISARSASDGERRAYRELYS